MRVADLAEVNSLNKNLAVHRALRDRLASAEPLTLMVGQGQNTAAIALTSAYLHELRARLLGDFDGRIAELVQQLQALGVEP